MTGSVLDTSVLIAVDEQRALDLPERSSISVVSLGELRAGVLRARGPASRSVRAARLADVRSAFAALVVDAAVADQYGAALAHARGAGRIVKATDLLIIATAAATGRELVTLDTAQAALARELGLHAGAP